MTTPDPTLFQTTITAIISSVIGGTVVAVVSYFSSKMLAKHAAELNRRNEIFSRTFEKREEMISAIYSAAKTVYAVFFCIDTDVDKIKKLDFKVTTGHQQFVVDELWKEVHKYKFYIPANVEDKILMFILCAQANMSLYRFLARPTHNWKTYDKAKLEKHCRDLDAFKEHLEKSLNDVKHALEGVLKTNLE